MQIALEYLKLTKPRLIVLVLLTAVMGYFVARERALFDQGLLVLLLGAGLSASGSAVLNQYLERDLDAKMSHARNRPLPRGTLSPADALAFGMVLSLAGVAFLVIFSNLLTAFLCLLSSFIYVLLYTPLKRVTWLNTSIGAVAGALPPVGGFAAATGHIEAPALMLFLILYVWQHVHFYVLSWTFRSDYRLAGIKVLSVIDESGEKVFRSVLGYALALIPLSVLFVVSCRQGPATTILTLMSGLALIVLSERWFVRRSEWNAKVLFHGALLYFPAMLTGFLVDHLF